jgi:hypothetical protein
VSFEDRVEDSVVDNSCLTMSRLSRSKIASVYFFVSLFPFNASLIDVLAKRMFPFLGSLLFPFIHVPFSK